MADNLPKRQHMEEITVNIPGTPPFCFSAAEYTRSLDIWFDISGVNDPYWSVCYTQHDFW